MDKALSFQSVPSGKVGVMDKRKWNMLKCKHANQTKDELFLCRKCGEYGNKCFDCGKRLFHICGW